MIELTPKHFIHSIFHCHGETQNFLGCIFRKAENDHEEETLGGWHLVYRFRYFKDDKAFGSKDEKNWYAFEGAPADSPDEMLEKLLDTVSKVEPFIVSQMKQSSTDRTSSPYFRHIFNLWGDDPTIMETLQGNKYLNFARQEDLN